MAIANVVVSYGIAVLTQLIVFPWFRLPGHSTTRWRSGGILTAVSIARSFALRQLFEAMRVRRAAARTRIAGSLTPLRISRLRIQNFRSIKDLIVDLGATTVFIGQNNAGKTAIIDAIRIVLTRRWGQRGTGFTENDVHRPEPDCDPRTEPPVTITLTMEEGAPNEWDPDMVAALNDIIAIAAPKDGLV